jgi:hypothetical protein
VWLLQYARAAVARRRADAHRPVEHERADRDGNRADVERRDVRRSADAESEDAQPANPRREDVKELVHEQLQENEKHCAGSRVKRPGRQRDNTNETAIEDGGLLAWLASHPTSPTTRPE